MTEQVHHNADRARFELVVEGQLCRADYRLEGACMNVFHTEVPAALEGKGLASKLVRAVFDHARDHGRTVRPTCSYVRAWARRHPELESLLET